MTDNIVEDESIKYPRTILDPRNLKQSPKLGVLIWRPRRKEALNARRAPRWMRTKTKGERHYSRTVTRASEALRRIGVEKTARRYRGEAEGGKE